MNVARPMSAAASAAASAAGFPAAASAAGFPAAARAAAGSALAAVAGRYDRWLFREYAADARSLAAFRVLFAAFVLAYVLPLALWIGDVPRMFFSPTLSPAALLGDFPSTRAVTGLNLATAGAFALLAAGLCTRTASVAGGAGLVLLYSLHYSHGKVSHSFLIAATPLLLAWSGWGRAYSVDALLAARRGRRTNVEAGGWPLALLALAVSLGMFTAGWAKVLGGWLSWEQSATLGHVARNYNSRGRTTWLGEWVLSLTNRPLLELLDWAAVGLECAFLVAFLNRRVFRLFVAAAATFHLGVMLLFGIQFISCLVAYGAFVAWAAPWAGRSAGGSGKWAVRLTAAAAAGAAGLLLAGNVAATVRIGERLTKALDLGAVKETLLWSGAAFGAAYLLAEAVRTGRRLLARG